MFYRIGPLNSFCQYNLLDQLGKKSTRKFFRASVTLRTPRRRVPHDRRTRRRTTQERRRKTEIKKCIMIN